MIFLIDAEKAFDKKKPYNHEKDFLTKCIYKKLKTIKTIYEKPTSNIIFNSKKLETFPLRANTKARMLFSSTV
jgi:hypothetical protein